MLYNVKLPTGTVLHVYGNKQNMTDVTKQKVNVDASCDETRN